MVTAGSSMIFRKRSKTSSRVSVGRRRPSSCASAALGITLIFVPALSMVAETVVRNMAWISGSRLRISSAVREAVAGSSSFATSGASQA